MDVCLVQKLLNMANSFVLELVGTFWYVMTSEVQIPSRTIRLSTHTHKKPPT